MDCLYFTQFSVVLKRVSTLFILSGCPKAFANFQGANIFFLYYLLIVHEKRYHCLLYKEEI